MKTIYKFFVLIFLAAGVVSCSDFLDKQPDDMLTLEKVFQSKPQTMEWLAGVYSNVPDTYFSMARELGFDSMGDDMAPTLAWQQWSWYVIDKQNGSWDTKSPWGGNYWVELPKRIRSALIFIQNVKPIEGTTITESEVELMKLECRFLIAYYYYLLIETYGTTPFNPAEIVATNADYTTMMAEQEPFDKIVDWLDKELLDLSTKLPASYTEEEKFGRATSIMCLAVRARMLLFAASPLVNGNPDYAEFKNKSGVTLFNPTYDPNKWVKAKDACKLLIDAAHSAGHALYYEYNDDGTIDPFMSYQNMMLKKHNEGNNEILFARPSDKGTLPNANQMAVKEYEWHASPRGVSGGSGGLGVTQSLVDAFFMKNGRPIDDFKSNYVERGFSTNAEIRNTKWTEGGGPNNVVGQITEAGTFNMYTNREPRFYISVLYNGEWMRTYGKYTNFLFNGTDGGPHHNSSMTGYLVRKKVNPNSNLKANVLPYRPSILYRLAEAYLNYAEALNEVEPNNPDILKYVNLVRERAGIPEYGSTMLAAPIGQDNMREAIKRERRVELNNEAGIRYFDIRRWKKGEELLNRDFYGMNFQGRAKSDDPNNPDAFYKRTVYQKRVFTKKNYWFPIPQSEVDKNPNLVQNPEW